MRPKDNYEYLNEKHTKAQKNLDCWTYQLDSLKENIEEQGNKSKHERDEREIEYNELKTKLSPHLFPPNTLSDNSVLRLTPICKHW